MPGGNAKVEVSFASKLSQKSGLFGFSPIFLCPVEWSPLAQLGKYLLSSEIPIKIRILWYGQGNLSLEEEKNLLVGMGNAWLIHSPS